MKSTLVIMALLSILLPLHPIDAAEITNVTSSQSGHHVVVAYDLEGDSPVAVNVDVTVDGITYRQGQLSLEGDVRKHVQPGKQRKFIWNVKRDFPDWPDIEFSVRCRE